MYGHIALKINAEQKPESDGDFQKTMFNLKAIIDNQLNLRIKTLTIGFSSGFPVDKIIEFLKFYISKYDIDKRKLKVSFIGKWYNLPFSAVNEIKELQDFSKNYSENFLNFVLNYSGREEILDACKILLRKAMSDKLSVDSLTMQNVKECIYTSNFPSPEKIIITGVRKASDGFLLWDCADSEIIFANKNAHEFTADDFKVVLEEDRDSFKNNI